MGQSITQIQTTIPVWLSCDLSERQAPGSPLNHLQSHWGLEALRGWPLSTKPTSDPTLDLREMGRTLNLGHRRRMEKQQRMSTSGGSQKKFGFFSVTEIKRCGL